MRKRFLQLLGLLAAITSCGQPPQVTSTSEITEESDDAVSTAVPDFELAGSLTATHRLYDLIQQPKLADCAGKKVAYDRRSTDEFPEGRCDTDVRVPAKYNCTYVGIVATFRDPISGKKALRQAFDDGFTVIDQCGETSTGKSVIYLVGQVGSTDDLRLKIRIIREP